MSSDRLPLFSRGSWSESKRISELLRRETVGGALLLIATVIALVWANSAWSDSYFSLMQTTIGPSAVHLDLTISTWAADGLLAIFFFVVGVELKREFVAGDLRDPARAALPIAAAVGGMAVPALIFVLVNLGTGDGALRGWAIPTATDIAFAVAVLAVISTHLPSSLRTFLLTLAVVDDLLAVTVIAVFYSDNLNFVALGLAIIPLGLFAFAVHKRNRSWWILLPLAAATWILFHESGVHATVAGVLLGFTVPVLRRDRADERPGMAEHFEHRIRPISSGVAVPLFAFCAAGVAVGGVSGLGRALTDPIAIGIVLGLVLGKTLGIFGTTFLVSKFSRASLDDGITWVDVLGLAMLAGIGFTVSLLIGDLAFGAGTERDDHVKVGVLVGSVLAATLASVVLRARNRTYRRIEEEEIRDDDNDGIPDVFQR
ncbi:Na(+)/H(+) antiporter NhaA [Rhodococcoides trifolii]|uniref:Na(+)/H(+) antiporter NhaA n=1 Tax=Rhodococcoides trifolii TaxID=908250 RepID=A0A917LHC3_9NOCA|nr:Na+/H+ antiporter NhaA [Rhodococcus trifolii]GGG23770.1 Na(+)/H(+) antiporter NhaA [Rhodococcus trifolii]